MPIPTNSPSTTPASIHGRTIRQRLLMTAGSLSFHTFLRKISQNMANPTEALANEIRKTSTIKTGVTMFDQFMGSPFRKKFV